jgi:bifunctional non-homologous end joining protein LigD
MLSVRGLRDHWTMATIMGAVMTSADKSTVQLTHPDRVYWQDAGVTKAGLADYYAEAWPRMAPFVTNRPLALLRCPEGTAGQCFFQKHAWRGHAREVLTVQDPNDNSEEPILAIDSFDGVIGLVQGAALEIHPWQASLADLEHPDQIVMDLDPGEGITWQDLIDGAREVRGRLEKVGLNTFVKTTGGKGIHVVAPIKPVTDEMASDSPDRYVATLTKSKRVGHILIDYLRNQRGATAIAPYASRARAGAPVSMPLHWDELGPSIGPAHFTVKNAASRLAQADPWQDFRKAEVALKLK